MRSRSLGPLSQQELLQLDPHDADAEWVWFTGMIISGVCPTIQAELTNKIAAFTRIPPYRLTGAQASKAGRAHTRARGRSVAHAKFTTPRQVPALNVLIQGR
jgi:hypothetical protein